MNLNDIISNYGKAGMTLGPAMAMQSRTPINFVQGNQLPDQMLGMFQPPNALAQLPGLVSRYDPKGQITINVDRLPTETPGGLPKIGPTVTHEDIHGLLQKLDFSGKLDDIVRNNPAFAAIAKHMANQPGGSLTNEMPAYMGANDSDIGVDDPTRQKFLKTFVEHLATVDPKVASKYSALVNRTTPAPPPTFNQGFGY